MDTQAFNKASVCDTKKIVIFTSNSLVAHQHLAHLAPFFSQSNVEPVIFFTPDCKLPRANIPTLQKYAKYEDGILNDVVYPLLDNNPALNKRLSPTFNEMARAHNFTSYYIDKLTDPRVVEAVESPNTIGALSIFQDAIFKPDLISAIKDKGFFWNLHPGIPERGGMYLIFWSLVNGEKRHGYTLHEVDAGIDTGKIIGTYSNVIDPSKSVFESYVDFTRGGSEIIRQAVSTYLNTGEVPTIDREEKSGSYFSFPTEDDIAFARDKGIRMWGSPAEMVSIFTDFYGNESELSKAIKRAVFEIENGGEASSAEKLIPDYPMPVAGQFVQSLSR